jgi:hypothetical protein
MPFKILVQPIVVNLKNAILGPTPYSSIMQCNPPSVCFATWRSNLFYMYSFRVLYPGRTILCSSLDEKVSEEAGKTSEGGASSKVRSSTCALRSTRARWRWAARCGVAALGEIATAAGN